MSQELPEPPRDNHYADKPWPVQIERQRRGPFLLQLLARLVCALPQIAAGENTLPRASRGSARRKEQHPRPSSNNRSRPDNRRFASRSAPAPPTRKRVSEIAVWPFPNWPSH